GFINLKLSLTPCFSCFPRSDSLVPMLRGKGCVEATNLSFVLVCNASPLSSCPKSNLNPTLAISRNDAKQERAPNTPWNAVIPSVTDGSTKCARAIVLGALRLGQGDPSKHEPLPQSCNARRLCFLARRRKWRQFI